MKMIVMLSTTTGKSLLAWIMRNLMTVCVESHLVTSIVNTAEELWESHVGAAVG
jgi:hypothetical protein